MAEDNLGTANSLRVALLKSNSRSGKGDTSRSSPRNALKEIVVEKTSDENGRCSPESSSATPGSLSRKASLAIPRSKSTNLWSKLDNALIGLEDGVDGAPSSLSKWRKTALVRNAARRFRYSKPEKTEKVQSSQVIRVSTVVMKAVEKFKQALPRAHEKMLMRAKLEGFGVSPTQLYHLVEKSDSKEFERLGGLRGVVHSLNADVKNGVSGTESDLALRKRIYGTNTLPEKPMKSYFRFIWEAMQDVTLMILAACAVMSLLVGIPTEGWSEGWYDGAGILFSIFLVVFVTATSDYQQSLQFQALDKEKKKVSVEVTRAGRRQKVLVFDIVVGDVVHLSIGTIIPVDGLLITGSNLLVDESTMTGESEPVHKSPSSPFLMAGTSVQDGTGLLLCTGVGTLTEWGRLMEKLSDAEPDETPLQVKLEAVATLVGRLGLYVAVVVFAVLMLRLFLSTPWSEWGFDQVLLVVDYFAVAVTIIVVAVPEGLPLAVTLTLAFAMQRMMEDKALVRKLAACETMGSATTICSDKTGTLTANNMTVVKTWVGGKATLVDDAFTGLPIAPKFREVLLESMFLNTSGNVDERQMADGSVKRQLLGSPTEVAVLTLGVKMGGDFKGTREGVHIVKVEPFNSAKKKMAILVKTSDGRYRLHWKGAAEIISACCVKVTGPEGDALPLQADELASTINSFAEEALRTLSLGYRYLTPSEFPPSFSSTGVWPEKVPLPEDKLTLLGIVGIKDPLRPGVPGAVKMCQSAGIVVRMVTGDNLATAKAIARECGILTEGGVAIEGPKFRAMSDEEVAEIAPRIQVMARSSPTDKLRLVKHLRSVGEVVAVTGDGTNDAPALKEGDIGMAMGIAGTEVAKESADVIILDDNFLTIVTVAKWGRSVYNNIQKFVQFQLTVNIVALVVNFISACVTGTAPLTAVQLLWVNLIMDTLGALALATEPPDNSLMSRPPVGRYGRLITNVMWRNVAGQAVFQLIVMSVLQYKGAAILGYTGEDATLRCNTVLFNTFVFCQLFNEINSREIERINVLKGIFTNYLFLGVMVVSVVFQFLMVTVLGKFASTVPLTLDEWGLCIFIGFLGMPIGVLLKLIPVPETLPALPEDDEAYEGLPGSDEEQLTNSSH